jgi:hypothetical protein
LIKTHYLSALPLYKNRTSRRIKSVLVIDLKNCAWREQIISNIYSHHNKKFRLINSHYDCMYGERELHGTIRNCFLACKEYEDSKLPSKFQRAYFFHSFIRSTFNDAARTKSIQRRIIEWQWITIYKEQRRKRPWLILIQKQDFWRKGVKPPMSWTKTILLLSRLYQGTWKVQFRSGRPTALVHWP